MMANRTLYVLYQYDENSLHCMQADTLAVKDRFINYHGQFTARLNYSQSIYSKKQAYKRTMFIKIFSPLLFAAPDVHLKIFDELWVDEVTLKARWTAFFIKLNSQWGEHIFHASILLNANVAFLAIPSNDPSNNSSALHTARTAAQIASYVSVVTTFASMMLALLLDPHFFNLCEDYYINLPHISTST
ncbi:hypothetical protein DXG01_004858 [Tephrocybe rancida]|nr:hypothetical protein DXG01_004858 [Tephrocybe rancida]